MEKETDEKIDEQASKEIDKHTLREINSAITACCKSIQYYCCFEEFDTDKAIALAEAFEKLLITRAILTKN